MGVSIGDGRKAFAFNPQSISFTDPQNLLPFAFGALLFAGVCGLTLLAGLLTGVFGASWG